jgi:Xaa-Pro aminopeptidase
MREDRLNKLRKIMGEADAVVVTSHPNIFYLSGFTGTSANLFLTQERAILLTDSRYYIQARAQCPLFEVMEISGAVAKLTRELGVKVLGYESSMSVSAFQRLKNSVPEVELVDLAKELTELRAVKSEEEIACSRKAAQICDAAFQDILNLVKPGVTERELALELEFNVRRRGAAGMSFDTIIASGSRSAMPHAEPSEAQVQQGEFLLFDFGAVYEGYCSDMTRTVIVGEPNEKQLEIYDTVLRAQEAAVAALRAGRVCSDIDRIARDIIAESGYGKTFGHGLGHSVGIEIHEDPRLSPSCQTVLMKNMLITVEPGIYVEGFGGVRIEDLAVVGEDGAEILTKTGKKLIKL